ncbi:hypothetical protein ERO13_A03G108550v2 [Gossypium hirsutum]|nr:hypothetical protein ERO13_A03G108550v2 [Gossypium hirsutum]
MEGLRKTTEVLISALEEGEAAERAKNEETREALISLSSSPYAVVEKAPCQRHWKFIFPFVLGDFQCNILFPHIYSSFRRRSIGGNK